MTTRTYDTKAAIGLGISLIIVALALWWIAIERASAESANANVIAAEIGVEVTPAQSQYFDDGRISDADRRSAFEAWLSCARDKGVTFNDVELRYSGETISYSGDDRSAAIAAVADCRRDQYEAVALVHRRTIHFTQDELDEIEQRTQECSADPGAHLDQEPAIEEAVDALCERAAAAEVVGRP